MHITLRFSLYAHSHALVVHTYTLSSFRILFGLTKCLGVVVFVLNKCRKQGVERSTGYRPVHRPEATYAYKIYFFPSYLRIWTLWHISMFSYTFFDCVRMFYGGAYACFTFGLHRLLYLCLKSCYFGGVYHSMGELLWLSLWGSFAYLTSRFDIAKRGRKSIEFYKRRETNLIWIWFPFYLLQIRLIYILLCTCYFL